jgi:hypothetical protein
MNMQSVRPVFLLLFLVLLAAPGFSQSPDKVLKQAVQAMTRGKGEKTLRAIRSWRVQGTITNTKDGASGAYLAAAMAPNLYTGSFDLRGLEVSVGYSGKSGWMRDSRDGLRTLTGQSSRDFQTEALFRNSRWLDFKREKAKLAFAGQTPVNGKAANTVVMTTAKNVKIKLYFDAASGLLVREELPAGAVTRIFEYSDYRPVNNVMEPHAVSVSIGEQRYEIKLNAIEHNPALDRARHSRPAPATQGK